MGVSLLGFLLVSAFLINADVGTCQQNCKVIAECDGQISWKKLPFAKRGEIEIESEIEAPPEIAVNVQDITSQQGEVDSNSGPEMHFYRSTLTWSSGKAFCNNLGKRLCRSTELCTYGSGGREFLFDVVPGDNWVPVVDAANEWLEIGDSHLRTCFTHGPNYGPPPWGTTTISKPYKGYVFCCSGRDGNDRQAFSVVKYQYLGNLATYESSRQHCEDQDLRLCSSAEVCRGDSPVYGVVAGDMWVAVNDRDNEWVEIGNSAGRTCWIHGDRYGPPSWGNRPNGRAVPHVGYVYCCN